GSRAFFEPRFGHDVSQVRVRQAAPRRLQASLTVGQPNDKYEQEADRVAEQVVSGGLSPTNVNHAHNHVQRGMSTKTEEEDAEKKTVQRKSNSDGKSKMPSETESYIQSLSGGGRPLFPSEAQYYEPRFGQSFNDVRIHTGGAANRAAKSINARAFTLGKNIAFADGEHDSSSVPGRKLMAHELTHTLQQSKDPHSVQRGSAGIFGGKCCLRAPRVEWALVGAGVWKKLEQEQCTGATEDCDGMTCGGGFYRMDNGEAGSCSTPRSDDATFTPRRWTPSSAGASAHSPTQEGSAGGDTPPKYAYDSAPTATCPSGVRTISVDLITLDGATVSPAAQLATANAAFRGCCVQFVAGATPPKESLATTQSWLGGDTDLNLSGVTCGTPTTEESSMYTGATAAHGLSSRMRVFFPGSTSGYQARAFSRPPYCAGGFANHVVIYPSALPDTLAHEFGHILLNSGTHAGIVNPADVTNLMFAPGRTGSNLDTSQCATIFGNA
ncbi:MAG TPA: DUF4157 domain-containing protein, partial [Terriglobales bacterium]|nr:DUF4157 domain-containing protein [Terriglobales bacterium]